MRRFHSVFVAAIALSSSYCVVGIGDPSCASGGASILISPSTVIVAVGGSFTPKASWCQNGRWNNMNPRWSLGQASDATFISLDPTTGQITGRRAGRATVIAMSDGVQGASVTVTVR